MKDKVVYIGSNVPDKTPAGVRVFANSLALREFGYDVKIISTDIDFQNKFDQNEGIDTWYLKRARSMSDWIASLTGVKSYTDIIDSIGEVKVVIAYELPAIVFLRLGKYCKKKGVKLICETTEWQKWENLGHLGFVARIIRLIDINLNMRYTYKKGDGIIVSSHYFADYFKNSLPVLILPTLQCYRLDIVNDNINNHPRKFIYAGGLGYQKDMLVEIIHAFAEISERDFEFNILGLTKEQYIERYENDELLIESINKRQNKIKFWGKVTHNIVLNELVKSDFSMIIRQASHRNNVGFPTKFGESINCGTPVIVTDFSDVVHYTMKYDLGIVTEVNNIVDGIKRALDMDDISFQLMRQRCRDCNAFYYEGHVNDLGEFVKNV